LGIETIDSIYARMAIPDEDVLFGIPSPFKSAALPDFGCMQTIKQIVEQWANVESGWNFRSFSAIVFD